MVIADMNVLFQSTAFSSLIFLQSADIIVYWSRSQENCLSTKRGEALQSRHVSSTTSTTAAGTRWSKHGTAVCALLNQELNPSCAPGTAHQKFWSSTSTLFIPFSI